MLGRRVEYGFDLSTYAAFGVEVAEVWIGSSMVLIPCEKPRVSGLEFSTLI